jgi:hypothetical protein
MKTKTTQNNTKPFLQKYGFCRGSVWYDGDEEHSERGPHKEGQYDNIFKNLIFSSLKKLLTSMLSFEHKQQKRLAVT